MKPVLKVPGSMLLKLRCDRPLANFAFKFNLRRYTTGDPGADAHLSVATTGSAVQVAIETRVESAYAISA